MKKLPVILFSFVCGLQMLSAAAPADAYVYRYHRGVPAVDLDWGVLDDMQGQGQTPSQEGGSAPVPLTSPADTEATGKRLSRPFFTDPSNLQRIAPVSRAAPKIVIADPRPVVRPLAVAVLPQDNPEPVRAAPEDSSLRGYASPKPSRRVIAPSDITPVVEVEPVRAAAVDAEPLEESPVKAGPVKAAAVKAKPVRTTVVKAIPEPVKAKPVPVRAAVVETAPVKITPEKTEAVIAEPVKEVPVKAAPVKVAVAKAEPKAEPVETAPIKITPAKTEAVKAEPEIAPAITEPVRLAKSEPVRISPVAAAATEITPDEMKVAPPPSDISLNFDAASSEISDMVRKKLDVVAVQLQGAADVRMQIRAYAGVDEGGQSSARRMSLSRGLEVRSYLLERGIKATRLDVRALGSETDRAPIDRVDLVFVR